MFLKKIAPSPENIHAAIDCNSSQCKIALVKTVKTSPMDFKHHQSVYA